MRARGLTNASEVVAESARIFNHNGQLVWLNDGALILVGGAVLRQLIQKHVVTRLVNHGTPAEPKWVREFSPFVPTDAALKILLNAERRQNGSLLIRAPRPSPVAAAPDCASCSKMGFARGRLVLQQIGKRKYHQLPREFSAHT